MAGKVYWYWATKASLLCILRVGGLEQPTEPRNPHDKKKKQNAKRYVAPILGQIIVILEPQDWR